MSLPARLLTVPVILYRWLVSPVLGCNCRYCPSCSEYAIEALQRHGLMTLRVPKAYGGHGFSSLAYVCAVMEIAKGFRDRKIPCDVIWHDIDYMHKFLCFTFDEKHFPDPTRHNADLHKLGFHTVWMIDPGIGAEKAKHPAGGYSVYESGTAIDAWVKEIGGLLEQAPGHVETPVRVGKLHKIEVVGCAGDPVACRAHGGCEDDAAQAGESDEFASIHNPFHESCSFASTRNGYTVPYFSRCRFIPAFVATAHKNRQDCRRHAGTSNDQEPCRKISRRGNPVSI